MKYRTFERLGWQISEIGFGAWAIGGSWGTQSDDESVRALHTALDAGCNFIDTAQGYGDGRSERLIGRVLQERKSGPYVYVATKIPPKSPGGVATLSFPKSPRESQASGATNSPHFNKMAR